MRTVRVIAHALRLPVHYSVGAFRWLGGALAWLAMLRPQVWIVSGREQTSQLPLTVLCAVSNSGKNRNYILQRIFGDEYHGHRAGRCWIWNLSKLAPAAAGECPLILAELRQSHFRFVPQQDWFYVPTWVWGEIPLPRDAEADRKVNGDLRRIRRHGLTGEVTRDPAQFDDFYYNMYVPYIQEVFGNCATIASYRRMKAAFRRGALLLIKQGEKSIAGQLILRYGEGACLENMGIRDGNRAYVQEGAGCALYHYGLKHMQDEGLKKAWVAWSRPFLRDGVLRFKKKWSQRIVDSGSNGFALRASPHSAAVRAFLVNNPFVTERRGEYFAAVFAEGDQPPTDEELKLIDREYFHAGMDRLYLYCLGAEDAPEPSLVPDELREHMELRGAVDVPGAARSAPGRSRESRSFSGVA